MHAQGKKQAQTYVSDPDPWHRHSLQQWKNIYLKILRDLKEAEKVKKIWYEENENIKEEIENLKGNNIIVKLNSTTETKNLLEDWKTDVTRQKKEMGEHEYKTIEITESEEQNKKNDWQKVNRT